MKFDLIRFDSEIVEKLSIRERLFKKLISSCLNIDWEIYKEAKNDIQGLKIKEEKVFWGKVGRI